jgi:hypothetical protein
MPLIPTSQALKHIMISISAFHFSHRRSMHRNEATEFHSWELWQPDSIEMQMEYSHFTRPLYTALLHKQKALECLTQEIQHSSGRYKNGLTAAAVLFICIDVVESGGMGWRHHLNGAQELIQRGKLLQAKDESSAWIQYFDTACTTYATLPSINDRQALTPPQL